MGCRSPKKPMSLPPEAKDFGPMLRALRLSKGMTLRDLGIGSGVSISYISDIEQGRRLAPTPDRVEALAAHLEVDPRELVLASLRSRYTEDAYQVLKKYFTQGPSCPTQNTG